ncbi:hypothetical protein [Fibrivirga algicola]|uniref:Uncharacterized protein n=1 Tax=Fibrivirga algicola TaxID=2950420 RepID=A0ABX0QU95_9BACT|nr:hypothetical protein [Fibrivirga algicola]NID13784.1 hypothetical protein [Fibrivirga algicola]
MTPNPDLNIMGALSEMLKATPFVAVLIVAIYKLVNYVKDLIAASDARQLAHTAELKAQQEKHDVERSNTQTLLIGLTRDNVTSNGQLATAISQLQETSRTGHEQLMAEVKDIKTAVGRTSRTVNGTKPKPATA